MRAKKAATLLGALLVLSALAIPGGTARTGDAECGALETWIDDEAGNSGYATNQAGITLAGEVDIESFTVEEVGGNCEQLRFTLTVDPSKLLDLLSADGAVTGEMSSLEAFRQRATGYKRMLKAALRAE